MPLEEEVEMDNDKIIIEPVVTEKTNILRENDPKSYVFRVSSRANKIMVKKAVKDMFDVRPMSCRIINVKSKPRTSRTKSGNRSGSTTAWKKAIVTLSPGETIDIFEGV